MVYCNATEKAYLDANLNKINRKCSCFVYDVHDPTNCWMGAVYYISNFGGGSDPWLFISFFATLFIWLTLRRFSRDKHGKKNDSSLMTLGSALFKEKFWGWGCVGGGSLSMFLVLFLSRISFATQPRKISRDLNVALFPLFSIALTTTLIGFSNCWWAQQFRIAERQVKKTRPGSIVIPRVGFLRRTAFLLGYKVDGDIKRARTGSDNFLFIIFFSLECLFVLAGFLLLVLCFVLAGMQTQRSEIIARTWFLRTQLSFGCLIMVLVADICFAVAVRRYYGRAKTLMVWKEVDSGAAQTLTLQQVNSLKGKGAESYVTRKFTRFLLQVTLCAFGFFARILLMAAGRCPYISYQQDLYHGGDPAESATADLFSFLFLFCIALEVSRHMVGDSYFYWKAVRSEDTYSAFDHPEVHRHIALASIAGSIVMTIISVCIVIVDFYLSVKAGMFGRILYFLGYLLILGAIKDRKVFMIMLDGREAPQKILQAISAITIVGALAIYILAALFAGGNRFSGFLSTAVFLLSLAFAGIKSALLFFWEHDLVDYAEALVRVASKVSHEPQQGRDVDGQQEQHQGSDQGAGDQGDIPIRTGHSLRALDDFSALVSGGFVLWVLYAMVWNAIGLMMVLAVLGAGVGHWVRYFYYKGIKAAMEAEKLEMDKQPRRVLSRKRKLGIFCVQLFATITFLVSTQCCYFAGTQLPYYREQILIAGHRGVWMNGFAENSIEANLEAAKAGYHCAEYDMRMTLDQKLVVMHDLTLERTTDGTGNVFDKRMNDLQTLKLKREGTEELIEEYPYTLDEMLDITNNQIGMISNVEVKQDKNLSAIPLALDAICRLNLTATSFISTGDPRFQHLLYYLEPNITLEKDFLLHTSSMSIMMPGNVNIYAISAELLLFNTWIIPNAHAAGQMVLVYFLALETPGMINYFKAMGVDGFMLNNPQNCIDAGECPPKKKYVLPRTIYTGN